MGFPSQTQMPNGETTRQKDLEDKNFATSQSSAFQLWHYKDFKTQILSFFSQITLPTPKTDLKTGWHIGNNLAKEQAM